LLREVVGTGSMGVVYRAEDERFGRTVAVKVPARWEDDDAGRRRFLEEWRLGWHVSHPGLVHVLDHGERPGGSPYLVMEFLAGETLEQRLQREGALPVGETVRIGRAVAAALAALAAAGVVHRDVKPANILLVEGEGGAGGVKLLDLGIASSAQRGHSRIPPCEQILGTLAYMAPEQALGEPVDGRADVFALGRVLIRALTQGRPINQAPPPSLHALVLSMQSRDPAGRPSAARVEAELAKLEAHPEELASAA
jgi:serine/threonine-protein kinase